ncbi:MAG: hypothetical protein K6U74_07280 [Firmicutes bacterium]|nr:hypothetical protein [Bacillota bacterium]
MLGTLKKVLREERGDFIQNGLWIIVVVLVVAGAGYALANQGIAPKLNEIKTRVSSVVVPSIGQ